MKNCDDVEVCLQKRRNKKMMNRKWDDIYREGGTTFRFRNLKGRVTRLKQFGKFWHKRNKIFFNSLDLHIQ